MRSTVFLFVLSFLASALAKPFIENSFHRKLIEGPENYQVSYFADFDERVITFEVTVQTTGFVGFGINSSPSMSGADIIIAGVYQNGSTYFSDRHGVSYSEPLIDDEQNWNLIDATENSTHTFLKFSRSFDTCDSLQDVPISEDTLSIIWSYGETDDIAYHGAHRGSFSVNLLDPPLPPVDISELDVWKVTRKMVMPNVSTSYWCSIHKAPAWSEKRHIVGFNTLLESAEALKHTHHLVLYVCAPPPGENADEIFGPLVGHPGGECYPKPEDEIIPTDYCRTMLTTWAIGGKKMLFPEDVGYSIGEVGESVYIMYEIHYDNPEVLSNITFESTVEVYNTPELREHEAAVLIVDHSITFSFLIPGNTEHFVTAGHCSSACTERKLNPNGINFFNVMLHAHLTGRKMKLRHFRNGTELPWLSVDNNYAFDYQQNRNLRDHAKIMRGDHLTMECTADTTWKNSVTLGGLSTNEEMCQAIIWYYPKDELRFCESAYDEWTFMQRFGIEEIKWESIMEPPVVLAPASMANKTIIEVLNTMVDWTPEVLDQLQHDLRYTNHYEVSCGIDPAQPETRSARQIPVSYPIIDKEYEPENKCLNKN